ncbi:NifB/NifX family molybdenum-iron cluster-binding protein [Oscillibacter sp.]|uniref:NifB/NifX family molybdenum-iron cluster-binding protein n=1 Tax=Oscillibacter sp. TaxID=1945593 RepID=UPI0028A1DBD0|nr:NifB/NifX family molybdenum-iron cluster-binding protein [Oscillibacter sp.]
MPRPKKCRRVCSLPPSSAFLPIDGGAQKQPVILTVDEYETVRLIDKEGLSQEECGTYMEIARASAQLIYASARKKIASALVDGLPLKIEGGDYRLCSGAEASCGFGGCGRHRRCCGQPDKQSTGGMIMKKIAVTYENGQIFQHFGQTRQFKIYDAEDGKITGSSVADTNGSGHGALAGFLRGLGVDALICGGIGGGARTALSEAGIQIYGGVSGDADEAAAALLAGSLRYNPDASCSHHHDGEHAHTCGEHGCGEHHHGEHRHGGGEHGPGERHRGEHRHKEQH